MQETWELKYEKCDMDVNSVFRPCSTVRLDRSPPSSLLLNGRQLEGALALEFREHHSPPSHPEAVAQADQRTWLEA
jgi:hypothetical protein